MRKIVIIFLVFLFQSNIAANDALLEQAKNALIKKDFQTAMNLYSQIEKTGFGGSGLYQNMALASAGLHQDAMAILYLEKAQKYDPNNKQIQENLAAIIKRNSQIDNTSTNSGFVTNLHKVLGLLSIGFWIGLSLLSLLGICTIAYLNYPSWTNNLKLNYTLAAFLMLFVVSSLAAYLRHQNIYYNQGIIVIKENTTLKLGPDEASPEVISLPPGSKVMYKDHLDGWWQVETNYGDSGWIQSIQGQKI
jgi:hypothetical protein